MNTRYNKDQIALTRQTRVFIKEEVNFGVIVEPANGDLVRIVGAASFKQIPDMRENKETRNTRSQLAKTMGRLPHGTGSIPAYLKPSGTPGTAPLPDSALKGAFGTKTVRAADTVNAGTGTINSFTPGTIAHFAVGQPVLVAIGGHAELRRITSIDALVHVAPDFSLAPADGAVIYAAVGYTLADDLPSFSVWEDLGHTVICRPGTVFDKFSVTIDGSNEVTATFGNGYQREVRCGTDKLGKDVAAAGTPTITVVDGKKYDIGARFNLSDGTNTETKCIVTGKAPNGLDPTMTDLTVTRGTGAQAWVAGTGVDVYPWIPVGTDAGSIIQGRRGAATLNGVGTDILSLALTVDNKVSFHEDEKTSTGADYCASYSTPGLRAVTQKLEVYFRQMHLDIFADSAAIVIQELWCPSYAVDGNGYPVPGKVLAFMTPQTQFMMPDVGDKNGERILNIDCQPYGDSNNELSAWFM